MLNVLNYPKPLKVNGQVYPNSQAAYEALKDFTGAVQIEINYDQDNETKPSAASENLVASPFQVDTSKVFRIKVRQYMTQKASPGFDFMQKYNNNVPMPMRVMYGRVLEETKGMYKMELHARPTPMSICMKCGRQLTHPVSLLYGLGPECGEHFHINPLGTEEELNAVYEQMKATLAEVKWTGWVIKSAIEEREEVEA